MDTGKRDEAYCRLSEMFFTLACKKKVSTFSHTPENRYAQPHTYARTHCRRLAFLWRQTIRHAHPVMSAYAFWRLVGGIRGMLDKHTSRGKHMQRTRTRKRTQTHTFSAPEGRSLSVHSPVQVSWPRSSGERARLASGNLTPPIRAHDHFVKWIPSLYS